MHIIYLMMLYIVGNVDQKFNLLCFTGAEKISCKKYKLLKSSLTATDVS